MAAIATVYTVALSATCLTSFGYGEWCLPPFLAVDEFCMGTGWSCIYCHVSQFPKLQPKTMSHRSQFNVISQGESNPKQLNQLNPPAAAVVP